jgi:hypothetical protein
MLVRLGQVQQVRTIAEASTGPNLQRATIDGVLTLASTRPFIFMCQFILKVRGLTIFVSKDFGFFDNRFETIFTKLLSYNFFDIFIVFIDYA